MTGAGWKYWKNSAKLNAEFQLDRFVFGIIVLGLKISHMFDILHEILMNFMEIEYKFFSGRSSMKWKFS